MQFLVDLKDQQQIMKTFQAAPRKFGYAVAGVLNTMAFRARGHQIKSLHDTQTIRNPRFVSSRIRVRKAVVRHGIDRMRSESGSIRGPRFSGWVEQETGAGDRRKRTVSEAAREGDWKKTIPAKRRMKPGNQFHRVQEFRQGKHKSYGQAMVSMIIASRKGGLRRPFIITKGGGPGRLSRFKSGIYDRVKNKIARISTFGKRPKKPRVTRWHTKAIERTKRTIDRSRLWKQQLQRVIKFK